MENSKEGTTVRQNSTYTSSRKHEANLRRNPTLHFQIGLILALLASIFFIEMRTVEKDFAVVEPTESYDEVYTIGEVRVEKKEVKVKKKVQPKKQQEPKVLDNIKKQEDDVKDLVEDLTSDSEPDDTKMVEPGSVTEVEEPVEPETVPFVAIETVPLFPGCEGLSDNDERRDCMSANISKFVTKKFRAERGEGLGLEGVNRIYVNFKIDKFGKVVEVKARAPHPKLEKEALRVARLLPDMTPGKQGGKDVAVLFSLPIIFEIRD